MKDRIKRYLLCLLLAVGLAGVLSGAALADGLEVHFLNIGRNDGILIRSGGESAFLDAGVYSRGKQAKKYMQDIGMTELTYYIGTHAHADHVGGAAVILEAFRPQAVIQPHAGVKWTIENNAATSAEKKAVKETPFVNLTAGEVLRVGDATLTCLGPLYIRNVNVGATEENANSLVLMLSYGETNILLTGDATNEAIRELVGAYPGGLHAEVYKNAHHGATTDEDVLAAVKPKYTIISTDESSKPTKEMRGWLQEAGSVILATAPTHCGKVILYSDGTNISFEVENKAQSLTVKQSEISVYRGKRTRVEAVLRPSNRLKLLHYESSDPSVATVDYDGYVIGVKPGQAVIRVSDGSGLYAECTVTVKSPYLKLKQSTLTVKDGSRASLSWSVEPSGSQDAPVWVSADESIAAVDQKGRVTGIYPGQTVVTATMPSGAVSEIPITVTPVSVSKVKIKQSSVTMTIGNSQSVSATVSPSNATWKDVAWSCEDESIVTIDQNGLLRAVGVGKTKITASTIEGKSHSISVTVKPLYVKKILLPQGSVELTLGVQGYEIAQLLHVIEPSDATFPQVAWSSSNKNIVSVDENGMVTAHRQGKADITCRALDGSGRSAKIRVYVELPSEQIVLKKNVLNIHEGTAARIEASVKPSSSTKKLFYESLNPAVAVVDHSGRVTGVRSGTAVIRISDAPGVYAECTVNVSETEMTLKKTGLTVKDGSRVSAEWRMNPSSAVPVIVWTSEDESIATVDGSGRITGEYPGETVVRAQMPGGRTHEIQVSVKPIPVSKVTIKPSRVTMTIGESRSVSAEVSPSNATWKDVRWYSSDESIMTVTQDGCLQAVGVGKTKLNAESENGKKASITVVVEPVYITRMALSKAPEDLVAGVNGRNQTQLTCAIEPADATIQTLEWSTSNKKIAVVNANGVVTGLKAGTVTITAKATDGSGRSAKVKVTFAENQLLRTVRKTEGEMIAAPSRIRYKDNNTALEVKMVYINRTGTRQYAPWRGMLVLITPDGTEIPLQQVNSRQEVINHGREKEYVYRVPLSVNPRLIGLDLTRCEAAMMNLIP